MSTLPVIAISSLAAMGLAVLPQTDLPWKDLASGSAALLLLVSFFVFLKHSTDQRKESHETIRKAHETICIQAEQQTKSNERFAQALEQVTSSFGQTTLSIQKQCNEANAVLLHEAREAHQKCEETIHSLLRGRRSPDRRDQETT